MIKAKKILPIFFLFSFLIIISVAFAADSVTYDSYTISELYAATPASPISITGINTDRFDIDFNDLELNGAGNFTIILIDSGVSSNGVFYRAGYWGGDFYLEAGTWYSNGTYYSVESDAQISSTFNVLSCRIGAPYNDDYVLIDEVTKYSQDTNDFNPILYDTIYMYADDSCWDGSNDTDTAIYETIEETTAEEGIDDIIVFLLGDSNTDGVGVPLVVILFCGAIGYHFAASVGFIAGLNIGIMLAVQLLGFPEWSYVGIVVVDVLYFFGGRE